MPLDRRTLRELLAAPLLDEAERRAIVVVTATGDRSRQTLHAISASVQGAQRRSPRHVVVELGPRVLTLPAFPDLVTRIHVIGVSSNEDAHPVTLQLASRTQGVIASPQRLRALASLPCEDAADDPVAAYIALLDRVFTRIREDHGHAPAPPPSTDDADEPAPPSAGTRRCELALLGVSGVTAQELLTALDLVMSQTRHRRCAHAGGGRDFVLLRGTAGAGLRVVDARTASAVDLAVPLASTLGRPVLIATTTGEDGLDPVSGRRRTDITWKLEEIDATGTGAAFEDRATVIDEANTAPLDERVCRHIAARVFSIEPEPEGLAIHYERA